MGMKTIGIAVLAAGASIRMGEAKLLMPFGGSTLLDRALTTALNSNVGEVAVITGAYAQDMTTVVSRHPVTVLNNQQWETGQASSVRRATTWAQEQTFDGLLLMVADQPFVTAQHLRNIMLAIEPESDIYVTAFGERMGNPALFLSSCFDRMQALSGDEGARVLIRDGLRGGVPGVRLVATQDPSVFEDIDDREAYCRAEARIKTFKNKRGWD